MISEKILYTQDFFCPFCKDIPSKMVLFNDNHSSQHFFDCWSFFHIIGGILLGLVVKNVEFVIIICVIFEIIENCFPGVMLWKVLGFSKLLNCYDTYINIIGDTLCVLLGFYISKLGIVSSFHFILSMLFIVLFFMLWMKNCSVTKQISNSLIKFNLL